MKKKLLKNFAILSLGLMGLFLIGNNVYGGEDDLDDGAIIIRCSRNPGYGAQCWKMEPVPNWPIIERCNWTGYTLDFCV